MITRQKNGKFVKGVSGNPNGRPRKEREERFYEVAVTAVTFKDWREIIEKAVYQAKRGDTAARKFLADYLMGVPVQKIEHGGPDGSGLQVEVVYTQNSVSPSRLSSEPISDSE